jgi:hypothetical protein
MWPGQTDAPKSCRKHHKGDAASRRATVRPRGLPHLPMVSVVPSANLVVVVPPADLVVMVIAGRPMAAIRVMIAVIAIGAVATIVVAVVMLIAHVRVAAHVLAAVTVLGKHRGSQNQARHGKHCEESFHRVSFERLRASEMARASCRNAPISPLFP